MEISWRTALELVERNSPEVVDEMLKDPCLEARRFSAYFGSADAEAFEKDAFGPGDLSANPPKRKANLVPNGFSVGRNNLRVQDDKGAERAVFVLRIKIECKQF